MTKYDWLVITINMGIWKEGFFEICKIFKFYLEKSEEEFDFKRIFIVLENPNPWLKTDCLWDSWYY